MITPEEAEQFRRECLSSLYEITNIMTVYPGMYGLPYLDSVTLEAMAVLLPTDGYEAVMNGLIIIAGWPRACNDNGGRTADRAEAFAAELLAMLEVNSREAEP